ncbi:MAG: hypothetical protein KAJ75_07780 [Alphaproteobacteria bacterium]|nr:hypothetical protein [Alphaproteobacteria bacterium]
MRNIEQHKGILNSVFKTHVVETNDMLGTYPEKVHVHALPERRYLWATRTLGIVSIGSLCSNIVLTLLIFMLIPTMRVTPTLLTFNNLYPELVSVSPSYVRTSASRTITEELVTDYLILRKTIVSDIDEMNHRWGIGSKLFWMSGNSWSRFQDTKEKELAYLRTKGLTREVVILNTSAIASSLYQITFDTKETYTNSEQPVMKRWRAFLKITRKPIPPEAELKNPFGFSVASFSIGSLPHPSETLSMLKKNQANIKPFIL